MRELVHSIQAISIVVENKVSKKFKSFSAGVSRIYNVYIILHCISSAACVINDQSTIKSLEMW